MLKKIRSKASLKSMRQAFSQGTAQGPKYQHPLPGSKRLFLGAWKPHVMGEFDSYHFGFLLTTSETALGHAEKAEGFQCWRFGASVDTRVTRSGDMAGAVYLGSVPSREDVVMRRGGTVDLMTPEDIGNFILALINHKQLTAYMPDQSKVDLYALTGFLEKHCNEHATKVVGGFRKFHEDFEYKPLPILDLLGNAITDDTYLVIGPRKFKANKT